MDDERGEVISYVIQERSSIGGIAFPWEDAPIEWATLASVREAMTVMPRQPDKVYRIMRVSRQVIPDGYLPD